MRHAKKAVAYSQSIPKHLKFLHSPSLDKVPTGHA